MTILLLGLSQVRYVMYSDAEALMVVFYFLCCVLCQVSDQVSAPPYPGAERIVTPFAKAPLRLVEPVPGARRVWVSMDGKSFGSERSSPDDVEKMLFPLAFYIVCEDDQGGLFSPVWWSTRVIPHPEFPGALTAPAFSGIDNYLHYIGPETSVAIPRSDSIKNMFVVLWLQERFDDVPQNLRILTLNRQDLLKVFEEGLLISDLDSLPRFTDHPQHNPISNVHSRAKKEADNLAEYDRRIIDGYYQALGVRDLFKALKDQVNTMDRE